jgi:hypothetical protein
VAVEVTAPQATPSATLARASVLERHPDAAWQRVDGDLVVLHCRRRRLFGLNPTGARTWELLDGRRTLAAIGQVIARELAVDARTVIADVLVFADVLARRQLARVVRPSPPPPRGR